MEKLFSALADTTRLRLLNLMRHDEVCVCFFTEALGESQPKISRHLAYLRNSGLVKARREGKWMHYSVNWPDDETARGLLENLLDWLSDKKELQTEHEKLVAACCSPDVPLTIAKAPKPESIVEANEPSRVNQKVEEEMETYLL